MNDWNLWKDVVIPILPVLGPLVLFYFGKEQLKIAKINAKVAHANLCFELRNEHLQCMVDFAVYSQLGLDAYHASKSPDPGMPVPRIMPSEAEWKMADTKFMRAWHMSSCLFGAEDSSEEAFEVSQCFQSARKECQFLSDPSVSGAGENSIDSVESLSRLIHARNKLHSLFHPRLDLSAEVGSIYELFRLSRPEG